MRLIRERAGCFSSLVFYLTLSCLSWAFSLYRRRWYNQSISVWMCRPSFFVSSLWRWQKLLYNKLDRFSDSIQVTSMLFCIEFVVFFPTAAVSSAIRSVVSLLLPPSLLQKYAFTAQKMSPSAPSRRKMSITHRAPPWTEHRVRQ